jgi:hypothetical protein
MCSLLPCPANAQKILNLNLQDSCSFYPEDKISAPVYSFESSAEALSVVKQITNTVGLEPNFNVLQASVPNAVAVIQDKERVILYSLVFMQRITNSTATEWSARTILAHEIGHHLNGHTLLGVGSRPPLELQADRFAGHAVRLMGGSLEQAMAAYQLLSLAGTETHPPKSARLEAVTKGWTEAAGGSPLSVTSASPKQGDALARELIDSLRAGNPPYSHMSPSLAATVKGEADGSLARIKMAGLSASIEEQGKHVSMDGNTYYLYNLTSGSSKVSCIIGIDKDRKLNVLHCQ